MVVVKNAVIDIIVVIATIVAVILVVSVLVINSGGAIYSSLPSTIVIVIFNRSPPNSNNSVPATNGFPLFNITRKLLSLLGMLLHILSTVNINGRVICDSGGNVIKYFNCVVPIT